MDSGGRVIEPGIRIRGGWMEGKNDISYLSFNQTSCKTLTGFVIVLPLTDSVTI